MYIEGESERPDGAAKVRSKVDAGGCWVVADGRRKDGTGARFVGDASWILKEREQKGGAEGDLVFRRVPS